MTLLGRHGVTNAEVIEAKLAEQLRDSWRARYRRALERERKEAGRLDYEWHAFSFETYPALSGEAAVDAYRERRRPVIVMTAHARETLVAARCATAPTFEPRGPRSPLPPDLLVFPEDLSWTFAMTHEAGWLGPYFATA